MSAEGISEEFNIIQFGLDHANGQDSIRCPCLDCSNIINMFVEEVKGRVFFRDIPKLSNVDIPRGGRRR